MFRLSQCLQKHYLKNKVPVSIFAIFTMGKFFAEHNCTGFFSYILVLYSNSSNRVFFFFFSCRPHRWPCSQIWKGFFGNQIQHCGWNPNCFKVKAIRWSTQTDPRARWADWGLSVAGGHWIHSILNFRVYQWIDGQWGSLKHWSY